MQRPRFNILIKSQAGLGYVAILVLLAILSTMGLAFIYKVGLMSSITLNRRTSMQSHYLAESAANHALWNLLNNPEFAPESDKYYMHSLGDGRYGYKVRMPTEITFATVATVGAAGDIVTQQSYVQYIIPSNVFTTYGSSTNPLPIYRRLIGAQWTDPGDVLIGGAETIYWTELEGCPIRKELVAGIIDSIGEIKVTVYDGATWGNAEPFGHGDQNYKCFDIAYESQSGDALVISRDGTNTTVNYNIWDGTSWAFANPQTAFNLDSAYLRLVTMASCPGNDDILIATVDSDASLKVIHWNGSAFADLGTIVNGGIPTGNYGIVQIVYEQQSGDAMIIWSSAGEVRYRIWNGSTLGPENIISLIPDDVFVLRAAADPASDTIVLASIDKFYDITVVVWDGDAWIDSREVETSCANNDVQALDVAWEVSGEDAVVAWSSWGLTNVRYLLWQKGTALADSTIQEGPDLQQQPWLVRLHPISKSEKIILLSETNSNDLHYSLWTGDQFKGDPGILLESNVPVQNEVAFDITEANVPRTGGTGTGVGINLAPVVDAGPDQTLIYPTVETSLDGTVTDDGLPNPPAAVTTTWSLVSGPGAVVFGDASQVDTKIKVSDPGTYVLRLTADDSELSSSDDVTITVDAGTCRLLFVVTNPASLTSQESLRKTLMESWGWSVSLIDDNDTQANFDSAAAINDVAYISEQVDATALSTKLRDAAIGLVSESRALVNTYGFASNSETFDDLQIDITDNSHYVTTPFSIGPLTITTIDTWLVLATGTLAGGAQSLGTESGTTESVMIAIDTGGALYGGGTAAERRIKLPWGRTGFDFNRLNTDGKTIMKRAIEWAAHQEGGCYGCDFDYTPDSKVGEFSTSAYGSGSIEGVDYLPEGTSFKLIGAPAGGALISVDMGDMLYVTDLAGNLLTSLALPSGTPTGVTLVPTGTWANHIAVSDKFSDEIKYFDLSGNLVSSFSTDVSADFNGTTPEDVTFIGTTASGTYDNHLAIPDLGRDKVFLVDQNGNWVSSIDLLGIMANVKDAAHVPGTDKLLLVDSGGQAFIVDFLGNLLKQYDTASFGTSSPAAVTINPLTCDHLVGDDTPDLIVKLNLLGGSSDTDPPTPDPMTWAGPPTADGPNSIRMTATTASDPSGVEYYFECTAGGGNDSGWQDSATYADTGLSPATSYTYRVKARDKSANQNETGWSAEVSATTTSNVMYVQDIAMSYRKQGVFYYGRATVWIRSEDGANISGAIVSGDWSGAVGGTSMGTTGSDGKVMLESSGKKNGGTFTFTVTNVTKLDYTYNSSLNVETSDSITAP